MDCNISLYNTSNSHLSFAYHLLFFCLVSNKDQIYKLFNKYKNWNTIYKEQVYHDNLNCPYFLKDQIKLFKLFYNNILSRSTIIVVFPLSYLPSLYCSFYFHWFHLEHPRRLYFYKSTNVTNIFAVSAKI